MKKIYVSMLALTVAFGANAQFAPTQLQKAKAQENTVALEQPTPAPSVVATGDTINGLYYDFSNQANWVLANTSSDGTDWEFTTVGPPQGPGLLSYSYGVLASTTAANGWVMFESDAKGASGSTHDGTITLANSVDLTGFSSVAVTFQQLYAKFQGTCYVEVSTDGSAWTQYEVNAAQAVNTASSNDGDIVQVNISSAIAANPATVWIRFHYVGGWDYCWQVDDVAFVEAAGNDVELTDVWHGDIINAFEYNQIPLAQATEVVIGATCTNMGGAAQTNVIYTYDISDGSSSVNSGTFAAGNTSIAPTAGDTTWFATGFTPSATGTYTVSVSAASDQTDEVPGNNDGESIFKVTDNIYTHDDEDNIEFQIYGGLNPSNEPNEYKVAMYYEIFADATLTAVQVAFGGNTTTSSCIVEVYDAVNDQALSNPLVTEVYDIMPGDVPSGGATNLVNILINDGDGVDLVQDGVYLIAIGNTGDGEDLWILASDGDDDRGQLQYGPFGAGSAIDWYTGYSTSPMLRANFDETVGIEENEDVAGVNIYPNPANENVTVRFTSKEDQDITVNVLNLTGSLIQSEQVVTKAGQTDRVVFNTESLSAGVYMVQLVGASSTLTERIVVR